MIRATGNRVDEELPLATRPVHLFTPLVMLPALVFLENVLLAASGALGPSNTEGMRKTTEHYLEVTRGLGVAGTLLFLAILPGICEEVVFRGFVFRALRNYRGPTGAILISAALFALIHDMSQWGYAFTMGMLLGFLRARTASLMTPILIHVGFNTLVLMTSLPGWPLVLPDRLLTATEIALWGAGALAMVGGAMALMTWLTRNVPPEVLDGGGDDNNARALPR
jgi:membrane protease YdiL (CAAX protease family)